MLDTSLVLSLFELYSGQESHENSPFIMLAMEEMKRITDIYSTHTDQRINFLCAAIANYRYQQARAAADNSMYTYAGEMIQAKKGTPLAYAESMLRDYYQICRDIIKPSNFVFVGFSKESDLDD